MGILLQQGIGDTIRFSLTPEPGGDRTVEVRAAQELGDARARGDISDSEYQELLEDLKRLDEIQLSADELDQQIAFNECIDLLKSLPLP